MIAVLPFRSWVMAPETTPQRKLIGVASRSLPWKDRPMPPGPAREDAERRSREQAARASDASNQPVSDAASPRAPVSPAGIIALQHGVGNAAVSRAMLARDDGATATAAPGARTPDEAFADA